MTKRILALVLALMLALAALTALAEANGTINIDKAHFPDEKFRALVKLNDFNRDGKLSDTERKLVVSLSVPGMGITSLKGIEYFPNLLNLYASNNKLRSLDLSKNTHLIGLTVDNNRLTSLNPGKSKQLMILIASGNRLSQINLTRNKGILAVCLEDNRLRSVKLGALPKLTFLRVSGNKLKTLDIKSCPKLRAYLSSAPTEKDGVLTWGAQRGLVIDATTKLTSGTRVLYPVK